jgi:N utilization substance protein B
MRKRTKARQFALQILYQVDITGNPIESVFQDFWARESDADEDVKKFATLLVEGTTQHQKTIDQLISKHSIGWNLGRMPVVDRNILRVAVFELLYVVDVSASVTINEALELARRFSTEESVKFINAVLDNIKDHQDEVQAHELMSSAGKN